MPASLGKSILSIGTDNSLLEKGIDAAESKVKAFVGRVKSTLGAISMDALAATITGGMSTAVKATEGLVDGLGKVGLALQGLKSIGQSVQGAIGFLTNSNAALEMTTISFQTLLGSASGATDMIKQLTDFAASTPFELTGLEGNTQRLLAFGFSAQDIIPIMTSLGDAISALGGTQDNLNSLVYVMGQMRSEAHINAGDIMQMVNLGIPALQMLADHYHVTTSEIQDMISKGLIPGQDAVKIFTESLEQRYGGMMAAQSATFSGMVSNLQDWANSTMIILTKPFFEPAKAGLKALLDYVQSPAGEAAVNRLASYIQRGVDLATAAFVRALPYIKAWFANLQATYQLVMARLTPGITGLSNQVQALWVRFGPAIKAIWAFHEAINPLGIALAVLKGYLTGGVDGAVQAFQKRILLIQNYLQRGLDLALRVARQFGPRILAWALDVAQKLAQQVLTWGEALVNWVLPYIPVLLSNLLVLAGRVLNFILNEASILGAYLLNWGVELYSWVLPQIPRVLSFLTQFALEILFTIERLAPNFVASLLSWTDALVGWVIPAVPGIIAALVILSRQVITWTVVNFPRMFAAVVLAVGSGLGANLRKPISGILYIFQALVASIQTYILPAFSQMAVVIQGQVWPVLDGLTLILSNAVIPTLAAMVGFLMTTGLSAFLSVATIVLTFLTPVFIALGDVIRNDFLPVITELWDWFANRYLGTVENLAAALGDRLAAGIELAGAKFKDATPSIEAFIEKMVPLAGKAIALWEALSPLNIAFDVLIGFLTGGLNGAWEALSRHVVDAGRVFGVDLQPAMTGISDTVKNVIIPALQGFWTFLTGQVLPNVVSGVQTIIAKFIEFGQWVGLNIWPVLQTVFAWIVANIGPIFTSTADTVSKTIIPALKDFFDWVGTKLWPKLQEVFRWIDLNVRPIFETAFGIIANNIIPTVGDFINLVLNKVIPVLTDWWSIISTYLKPIFEQLVNFYNAYLLPTIKSIWEWVQQKGIPAFSNLATIIQNNVFPVLRTLADILGNTVGKAIGFVLDRIKNLIDFWNVVITIGQKLLSGDITGAINYALSELGTLFKSPDVNINANPDGLKQLNSYAGGTLDAPGGPALVGDNPFGPEIVNLGKWSFMATQPTFLNLPRHAQVLTSTNISSSRANSETNNKNVELHLHQNVTPQQAERSAQSFATLYGLYGI